MPSDGERLSPGAISRNESRREIARDERPLFWPLVPNGLTADMLRRFAPLGFGALAIGRSLGFLGDAELRKILRDRLTFGDAPDLALFLDTASTFDRNRDIAEELDRLAGSDPPHAQPLWAIVGRIILEECDPNEAVATLEQVYGWFDYPPELRPYTLFARPAFEGRSTTACTVERFDAFLRDRGL